MPPRPLSFCSAAAFLFGAAAAVAVAAPPSYEEVAESVLASRRAIRSGDVTFELRRRSLVPLVGAEPSSAVNRLVFDEESVRTDFRPQGPGAADRRRQAIVVPEKRYRLVYNGSAEADSGESGRLPSVAAYRLVPGEPAGRYDARLVGLTTSPFWGTYDQPLATFVDHSSREDETVEAIAGEDDETLYKLTARWTGRQDEATAEYTVDADRGWSVVAGRLITVRGHDRVTIEFEAEPKQYGDVWYPAKVTRRQIIGGLTLGEETVEVTAATFNRPIPPEAFGPEALEVPAGTRLDLTDDLPLTPGQWTEDGFQPDLPAAVEAVSQAADTVVPDASGFERTWAVIPAVGSACCLLGFVGRRVRRSGGRLGSPPFRQPPFQPVEGELYRQRHHRRGDRPLQHRPHPVPPQPCEDRLAVAAGGDEPAERRRSH